MELIIIILLYSSHTSSGILRWALCDITVHLDWTISRQLIYHMFMCFPFECYELWKNYSYWQEDISCIGFAESSWYYVIVYCRICRNDALYRENQTLFSYFDMLFAQCFMLQSAAYIDMASCLEIVSFAQNKQFGFAFWYGCMLKCWIKSRKSKVVMVHDARSSTTGRSMWLPCFVSALLLK